MDGSRQNHLQCHLESGKDTAFSGILGDQPALQQGINSVPTDRRTILVTSALPYANGSIHLGHMLEYIQTDVWVRYQKQSGHQCVYVCADDAHGTAIMLRAQKLGITPEQLIAEVKAEHEADFNGFHIGFDHYSSTHTDANRHY